MRDYEEDYDEDYAKFIVYDLCEENPPQCLRDTREIREENQAHFSNRDEDI